jgi:hypothetical protein
MWRAIYKPHTRAEHVFFDEQLAMGAPVSLRQFSDDISSPFGNSEYKQGSWWQAERFLKQLKEGLETKKRIQPIMDFLAEQELTYRRGVGEDHDYYYMDIPMELHNGTEVRLTVYASGYQRDARPRTVELQTKEFDYKRTVDIWLDQNRIYAQYSKSTDTSLLDELNETLALRQVSNT